MLARLLLALAHLETRLPMREATRSRRLTPLLLLSLFLALFSSSSCLADTDINQDKKADLVWQNPTI